MPRGTRPSRRRRREDVAVVGRDGSPPFFVICSATAIFPIRPLPLADCTLASFDRYGASSPVAIGEAPTVLWNLCYAFYSVGTEASTFVGLDKIIVSVD